MTHAEAGTADRATADGLADVGCVVIGRNEAPRLRRCLESILDACRNVLYVDSGSADDSVAIARALDVPVLELDPALPFSAARGRNEGFAQLRRSGGAELAFVQFVDGDCRLEPGWLAAGARALRGDASLAVVAGRSREDSCERSVWKRLCDIELDVAAAETGACGGVAMMRASALESVGGYDPALAAGEEPDLCLRLRRAGWRVGSLLVPMMRHELSIRSGWQWWRRCMRSGRAYFESWWKHRRGTEGYRRREVLRILLWGGATPWIALAAVLSWGAPGLLVLAGYAVPGARAHRWARRHGRRRGESLLYAAACVLGKVPECLGVLQSWGRRLARPCGRSLLAAGPASSALTMPGTRR